MSEPQKLFASLSGAFVAHGLLLLLFLVVPRSDLSGSSLGREKRASGGPREVTVMMGDLMERLEREREEDSEPPEPEPPRPEARPFIAADLNRPEPTAPENARFESDRNTSAAARLRPDERRPRTAVPTLDGDNPLPNVTLANREYVDGALTEPPAASPDPLARRPVEGSAFAAAPAPAPSSPAPQPQAPQPPAASASPPPAGSPEMAETPLLPSADPIGGGEKLEGELSVRPGRDGRDEAGASRERSFLDPTADPEALAAPDLPDGPDRLAAGTGSGQGGEGTPDPLATGSEEGAMAAGRPSEAKAEAEDPEIPATESRPGDKAPDTPPGESAPPAAADVPKTADDGLFAKGFSPEERQNLINGMLAREGDNAVDAEATAMGRYKKAVRDAISQRWHRYRQDNADFVTWGILKIEFSVDPAGRVRNLRITKNEANAMLAEFSLRAIRDAQLPPMPPDVAASVGAKGLVIQYDIIIY